MHTWYTKKGGMTGRWVPNDVKINCDVVVSQAGLFFTAVIRDDKGGILESRAGSRNGTSPLKGEALAIRLAVVLAEDMIWEDVTFQSDAQVLINQLSK